MENCLCNVPSIKLLNSIRLLFKDIKKNIDNKPKVEGLVLGCKSYGRSNSEDASTRDIIPDYSGNGRDIKLYNFDFAGKSGWGGGIPIIESYNNLFPNNNVTKINLSSAAGDNAEQLGPTSFIQKATGGWIYLANGAGYKVNSGDYTIPSYKVKITNLGSNSIEIRQFGGENFSDLVKIPLNEGINIVPSISGTITNDTMAEYKTFVLIQLDVISYTDGVRIDFLEEYPGGLVSDGVDDYGQCGKAFALPDDYTILAIREYPFNITQSYLASKGSVKGAFGFELRGLYPISYGKENYTNVGSRTALFGYQSKNVYNGYTIESGAAVDTEEYPLTLFSHDIQNYFLPCVLYDLRIYDHTLSATELESVKNEMMSDFIEGTGLLDGLDYVADWDAAGKSNEDADRDTWVDKVNGKTITLNNYAFAEMSGWNGYNINFNNWLSVSFIAGSINVSSNKFVIDVNSNTPGYILYTTTVKAKTDIEETKIKVSGLRDGSTWEYGYIDINGELQKYVVKNGINILPKSYNTKITEGSKTIGFYKGNILPNNQKIIVEQVPLYVGLVSDGVDDYGVTDEAITEEIGTMLCRLEDINTESTHYLLKGGSGDGYLYIYKYEDRIIAGKPQFDYKYPFSYLTRNPISINSELTIASSYAIGGFSNSCISRLILIKEQLSDIQLEALKYKVEKEYKDYIKKMGWE